jgi:hypothetical protein
MRREPRESPAGAQRLRRILDLGRRVLTKPTTSQSDAAAAGARSRPARVVGAGAPPLGGIDGILRRQAASEPLTRLNAVQESAKGWHTPQVAILGLIGIVGVSRGQGALVALPDPVKYVAVSAVIVAFAAASTGATLIARVAWPLWREQAALDANDDLAVRESVLKGQQRMRQAVTATVVALIAMGFAFALSWWPAAPIRQLAFAHGWVPRPSAATWSRVREQS